MKETFIIAQFTMRDMLNRKSFRISTLIILVLIVLGFNVPNLLQTFAGDNLDDKVLIADPDEIYGQHLDQLNETCPNCDEMIISHDNADIAKQKIIDGEVSSAIIVQEQDNTLEFNYLVKNAATAAQPPQDIISTLEKVYQTAAIEKLNLTPKELASISPTINITVSQTDETEISGNVFVMMMLSIILFYAIYFCAFQVSSSITTEKTSKIVETLVTSTSPTNIVLGKTIGIGIVGLLQMVLFVATALISAHTFLDSAMLNQIIDLSKLTLFLGIITALYFILGYFAYALLYALTGSTVGKPEDVQSANTPVALLGVISFYFAYFTLTDPTSSLNLFAAIFPFSSPFCMPLRIMMGLATPLEVFGSITILIITILIVAYIAIRIYSNAILHYGTKPTWKEIFQNFRTK